MRRSMFGAVLLVLVIALQILTVQSQYGGLCPLMPQQCRFQCGGMGYCAGYECICNAPLGAPFGMVNRGYGGYGRPGGFGLGGIGFQFPGGGFGYNPAFGWQG